MILPRRHDNLTSAVVAVGQGLFTLQLGCMGSEDCIESDANGLHNVELDDSMP